MSEKVNKEESYKEGLAKLAKLVVYLNDSGTLDALLDLVKDRNLMDFVKDFVKSPTFRAIMELLGHVKELIDSRVVNSQDFIDGVITIARHLDKIGKILSLLDQHGVLDVMTNGLTKAADIIVKSNDNEANIIELLASFDDPDVKKTLAYLKFLLKELGESVKPLLDGDKNMLERAGK
ncbi:MAG: hypothetical protein QXX36_02620 [Candidatus Rehaiarchaeum fermentans]|nr:hypothetical protein [Candidatus Rehaiarchaeum fermentans]